MDKRQDMDDITARYASQYVQHPADHDLAMEICRLLAKYKQIVLLYYYQGMNMRDVASALGIPVSTVQRRLKKAESLLKAELMGGEEDDG